MNAYKEGKPGIALSLYAVKAIYNLSSVKYY